MSLGANGRTGVDPPLGLSGVGRGSGTLQGRVQGGVIMATGSPDSVKEEEKQEVLAEATAVPEIPQKRKHDPLGARSLP